MKMDKTAGEPSIQLPEDIAALILSSFRDGGNDVLQQNGMVIWMTGLSGSGKSTIARLLEKKLAEKNLFSVVLDGDELRKTLNRDLGFSDIDRTENIRRAAELAKLLVQKNIIVICSFITPMQKHRDLAATITGEKYFEVSVNCPLYVCEQRDVKGLYHKARNHEITDFTGIGSAYQPAVSPDLVLNTAVETPEESAEKLLDCVFPIVKTESKQQS
ncbi:MAG TPA: adenylyl-sulfate kinase [Agriterribacter sp.]|nr:adenylyl-sulfate kinase [Agriterribacter sp.]